MTYKISVVTYPPSGMSMLVVSKDISIHTAKSISLSNASL